MKRKYKILLFILITILILNANVSAQVINNKKALQDLDYLVNRLEEVHPNIYYHLSEKEAEKKLNKIRERLTEKDNWNSFEIFKLFSPFVASFKDGHTYLSINNQFKDYYNKGGEIFPFDIKFIEDDVLIYNNYSKQDIEKDTRILSVNGIPINEIIDTVKACISSENNSYAKAIMERNLPIYMWALFDFNGHYNLLLKGSNGYEYDVKLEGVNKEARSKNTPEPKNENWSLHFPVEGNAYLIINTFSGSLRNAFERDIDKYFEEINKRDIKNLFIDISENGGGNTDLAKYLYEYCNDQPYSLFSEVRMKYSDYAFKNRSNSFTKLYYRLKKNEDDMLVFNSTIVEPKDRNHRFNGNLYVITSNFTFSTATDFAAIVKDHQAGKIIGEETGGLASCYGDIISDKLPNSKLLFGISYKYFLRPAGFDNGKGVLPDIEMDISKLKYQYDKEDFREMIIKSTVF